MNRYIQLISEIPNIQLNELHWTWAEAFLLLIAIFTGAGWLLLKSKSGATLTSCLGCLLMVLQWVDIFSHQKQEALVAYQSKSASMVSWIKGNQAIYLLDSNTRTRELKKNVLANASSRFYRIRQQTDTLLTPYFQIAEWIVIVPHRNISPPRPIIKNKKTIIQKRILKSNVVLIIKLRKLLFQQNNFGINKFKYGDDGLDVSKSEGGKINIKRIVSEVK